jgi:acyl-coenzyme A thioesterase PaaI-like protein
VTFSGTKDSSCYVCGSANPMGLHVPFRRDGEAGSVAVYIARPEHGGWNGIPHGGITFTLMDEALGWCLFFQDIRAVTARTQTRFHRPIPIGTRLHIRGWVTGKRRTLYDAKAEIRIGDGEGLLAAESEAVMCHIVAAQTHDEVEA